MFFNVGNTSYATSGEGDSYSRKYHCPSGEDGFLCKAVSGREMAHGFHR